jgi:hypothetical protein
MILLHDIKNTDYLYNLIGKENDSVILQENNIIFSLKLLDFKQLNNNNNDLLN